MRLSLLSFSPPADCRENGEQTSMPPAHRDQVITRKLIFRTLYATLKYQFRRDTLSVND
jgi:hypothetical protein